MFIYALWATVALSVAVVFWERRELRLSEGRVEVLRRQLDSALTPTLREDELNREIIRLQAVRRQIEGDRDAVQAQLDELRASVRRWGAA